MALKITGPDLARLHAALEAEPVKIFARHHLEHFKKLHNTPGNPLYQRDYLDRWRWDVFHKAQNHQITNGGISLMTLYDYLNDDNIAAALRRILPAG